MDQFPSLRRISKGECTHLVPQRGQARNGVGTNIVAIQSHRHY